MLSTGIELRRRRTLSPRFAYAHVAAAIGLALFASSTPSPLYGTYRALWGFSPVVLTLVYATYAVGVLGALMGASVLFMLASSLAWLFVARALQGLATGLVLSAASAALLDLHPRRDPA